MGQRSVRFPDELQAAAEKWALANDRSFSYVVVKALEAYLGVRSESVDAMAPSTPVAAPVGSTPARPLQEAPRRNRTRLDVEMASVGSDTLSEPSSGCPECGGSWGFDHAVGRPRCSECGAVAS